MTDRISSTLERAHEHHQTGAGRAREGGRSLNEPVLSSAEDELDVDIPAQDAGATYTAGGSSAWWSRTQGEVARYVSEQPGRAALMALGAGALAALLLGRGLRGRRRKE